MTTVSFRRCIGALILIYALPVLAESAADDCALARDPTRCEARQAALASCSEMHGTYKRACLEAALPPVDCGKSKNPARCESAQKAREACKGLTDQALRTCKQDQMPKKTKIGKKKKAKPSAKSRAKDSRKSK